MKLNKKGPQLKVIERGAEAGKIVDVGIVEAGAEAEKVADADIVAAEAGAETEAGATTADTEVPATRGGTVDTDTNAVAVVAKSARRDTDGVAVAAEAEKGAPKVPGREAAVQPTDMIAMQNKAVVKIQATKTELKALIM